MERPERIVLFMIGAFTNRMAGVLWVILVLSIVTVAEPDLLHVSRAERAPMPIAAKPLGGMLQARVLLDRRTRDAALRPAG